MDQFKGQRKVSKCCKFFSLTRQAYYKYYNSQESGEPLRKYVRQIVKQTRAQHPKMGTLKLHSLINKSLDNAMCKVGRDKLFSILRDEGLLIRRKRRFIVTTQSKHRFYKYKNLIKDWKPTGPHQLVVGDITYLRIKKGFCYLFLLTDAYSRKIVGWDLNSSLGLTGTLNAARMAIRQCPNPMGLIHHSDRGIQYCANEYVNLLEGNKIKISMGEAGNCYENAMAERINGILKHEYGLDSTFNNQKEALKAVREAIDLYNNKRPHLALKFKTPGEVHIAA
ncbi:MAG TPA: IS3 family transposase [Flavobacterium sp.]|nr:IS3 family transposase [Flavobacterium sp.]